MASVSSYVKNVAKSFGYAIGDVFSEYNPVISSMSKDIKSSSEEIFSAIKEIKVKVSGTDESSFRSQARNTVNDAWRNTMEDLRSGTFYNKARQAEAEKDMARALGFDMDFDMDFDFDEKEFGSEAEIASEAQSAAKTVQALDEVGYKISASVSTATVESANYIVDSNNKAARAIYSLTERGFTSVNKSLAAVNSTLGSFAQIAQPLTQHMQNAAIFYTKTTEKLETISSGIQEIVKNTKPAPLATEGKVRKQGGLFSGVFDSDSGLSIDAYKDMIKENFGEYKDLFVMATDALKGMKGKENSFGKNISPMQFMTVMITKAMIPKVFKESMKGLNESLKYAISGGLMRARGKQSNNIFLEIIKDMILPRDGYKEKINTANYNKGQVAWDGIARKALVEVIPSWLSKIYSALTGEEAKAYDYENGKLVSIGSIKQEKRNTQARYAREAGGDFRTDALKRVKDNGMLDDAQKAQLTKEIEDYFFKAFSKGGNFFVNDKDFKASDYGLSAESLKILQALIEDNRKTKNRSHSRFIGEVGIQRDRYGDKMRRDEANGNSNEIYLQNGFYDIDGSGKKRKGGVGTQGSLSEAISVLKAIFAKTAFIADNVPYLARRSDQLVKRKNTVRAGKEDENNVSAGNRVTGRERTRAAANTSSGEASSNLGDEGEPPSDDEDERYQQQRRENVKGAKSKVKEIFGKITGLFKKGNRDESPLMALYRGPFRAVSGVLDKIGLSLDKLIWGDDGNEEGGIFGYIFKRTKEAFNKLTDWLDDKLGIKDKLGKLKEKVLGVKGEDGTYSGGMMSGFVNETGQSLHKVSSSLGGTVKRFFSSGNNGTAAYGRKVTKSGVVTVSEGEMIIPAEYNPFYHGSVNKAAQRNNEARLTRNFFGMFADGTPSVGDDNKPGAGYKFIKSGIDTLGSGFSKVFSSMFGGDEKDVEKDKKIISSVGKKLMEEMGASKGAMGAGALIGAGASLLTGGVVGPIMGAAIGAGVGLIANSKTVQNVLFGADPETGEVNGGLLSKGISEFMVKQVPSMGKGAALGAGAGLFFGSPILGAIAGSTIGYITSSEKAKSWLFGEKDKDGNRTGGAIPKEFQDRVKKAAPHMAAGILASLVAGPFGIVGNVAMGAGLGLVTSSEGFHDWMFGNKETGQKGFVTNVKEKIFDNLDTIFHNMGNALAGWSKSLMDRTKNAIENFFTKKKTAFENGEGGILTKLIGGTLSLGGKAVNGVTNIAGGVLGKIARGTTSHNLKKGYNVYDREKKRNLTAAERVEARGKNASGTFANLDKEIVGMDQSDLKDLADKLQAAKNPNPAYIRKINKIITELESSLGDIDSRTGKKIVKLVEKGKVDAAISLAAEAGCEDMETAARAIRMAGEEFAKAKDEKENNTRILDQLKAKGIKLGKGDITTAIDRINDEAKQKELTPEQKAEQETKTFRDRLIDILEKIGIKIGAVEAKGGSDGEVGDSGNHNVSEVDMFGNVHQYEENNQGEKTEVKDDSETKKSREIINKFTDSISKIPFIGAAVAGMKGLFGSLKDKLIGDGENKKGILSKLFDFFSDDNSPVKKFFGLFSTIGKNMTFGTLLEGIVGPALIAAAFTGKFDSLGETLSNKIAALKGNDTAPTLANNKSMSYTGKDGNKYNIALDENGNPIKNEKGQYQTTDGQWVDAGGKLQVYQADTRVSTQLKKNLVNGVIMGSGKGLAGALTNTVAGHTAKKAGSAWAKMLGKEAAEGATKNPGLISGVMSTIAHALEKIPEVIGKIPFLPAAVKDNVDTIVTAIYSHLDDAVKSLGSKLSSFASKLSAAMPYIKAAYIVGKGINAWGNAESILGITEKASFGQRVIAVLIAIINAAIPVIGDLIPNKVLVNIFMDVAPKLGIDVSSLADQRARAQEEVEKYNAENGTDLSIEEYNQMNGRAGIFTKASNAIKSGWANLKEKGGGSAIKGIGMSIKETAGKAGAAIKGGLTKAAGKVNEIFNITDLVGLMKAGDLKGLLTYNAADEDDSTGMSVVKNIPVLVTKYFLAAPTALVGIGKSVFGFIKKIGTKIKCIFNIAAEEQKKAKEMLSDKDSTFQQFFTIEDPDPENPMGGVEKVFRFVNRISLLPFAIVNRIGVNLFKKVKDIGSAAVKGIKNMFTNNVNITKKVAEGDPSGLLGLEYEESEDNPLGGLNKVLFNVNKFMNVPLAGISWVGHKAVEGVVNAVKAAKTGFVNMFQNNMNITRKVTEGDPSGLLDLEYQESEDNPLGGVNKVIFSINKFLNVPLAGISWVGHKAVEGVGKIFNAAKTGFMNMMQNNAAIAEKVKAGDPGGLFDLEYEDSEDNPLGGLNKVLFTINKFANIPIAGISWLGHKAFEGIGEMIGKTKSNYSSMNSAIESIKKFAEEGDVGSIWSQEAEFEDGDPLKFVWNTSLFINKLFQSAVAIFNKIMGPIKEVLGKAKELVGGVVDGAKEWVGDKVDGLKEKAKSGWNSAKSWVSDKASAAWDWVTGGDSGFISQYDPRYQGYSVSGRRFADKGCGPAVATMAARATGRRMSVGQAVRASQGYQNENGVSLDYFAKVMGHGARVMSGGSSNDIYSSIASGRSTVLLGRDPLNTSKENSPFGPGNHYVLARGLDRHGNIIVNDPELSGPRAYSPSILRSVTYGISGGASDVDMQEIRKKYPHWDQMPGGTQNEILKAERAKLNSSSASTVTDTQVLAVAKQRNPHWDQMPEGAKTSILKSIRSELEKGSSSSSSATTTSEPSYKSEFDSPNARQVYQFLRNNGFSAAAAVGVIGNLYQESRLNPASIQGGGKGPAAGIAQWENYNTKAGRWQNLSNFASQNGKDWTDMDTQLKFMLGELNSNDINQRMSGAIAMSNLTKVGATPMSYAQFKAINDPINATRLFEGAFERAGQPNMSVREKVAADLFKAYEDASFTYTGESSMGVIGSSSSGSYGTTNGSTSGGEKKGGIGNILSLISSIFSKALGKVFGDNSDDEASAQQYSQENQSNSVAANSGNTALSRSGSPATGDMANNFPYYSQKENPWGPEPYTITNSPKQTIATSGCGPTSMAMVMKSFGENVTPTDTAKWSLSHGHRTANAGTAWSFFKAIGNEVGIQTNQFSDINAAKQALQMGAPVIGSMGPGDFTKGGHYIVFSGINKEGTEVTVNDPNSRERTGKVWNADAALKQSKGFFAFTKNGQGSIGKVPSLDSGNASTSKVEVSDEQVMLIAKQRNPHWDQMPEGAKTSILKSIRSELESGSTSAAGSGLMSYNDYVAMRSGGSSGLLLKARPGSRVNSGRINSINRSNPAFYGGDSAIIDKAKTALTNVADRAKTIATSSSGKGISPELVERLLGSITKLLENISGNTSYAQKIYDVLVQYTRVSAETSASAANAINNSKQSSQPDTNEIDATISELVGALGEITRG